MDVLDFPEMVADRYGVHSVEIVLPHFADPNPQRVAEFKLRLAKARSRVVNMPLDFGVLWNKPAISSTDPAERDAALAMYRKGHRHRARGRLADGTLRSGRRRISTIRR